MSEEWSWKLRLFVSADLVGSTAYKASQQHRRAPDWAPTFKYFFKEFPQFLASCYQDIRTRHSTWPVPKESLSPWKFSGDEILFTCVLHEHREVAPHLSAVKQAITTFFTVAWKEKPVPLKLKSTAWLAGFPVTNSELSLESQLGISIPDFIGPSIDLVFELQSFPITGNSFCQLIWL